MKASEETLKNIQTLNATKLKDKYPREYSRWSNMKQRRKSGAIIDPRFHKFADFLSHMGEIPDPSYTLDRIDNNDPTYSPEACRWADKQTQNNNKSSNIYLSHEGESRTIAQWSALTNQNPSTLYKRHAAGWSDAEIITGVREKVENDPWRNTPWPAEKQMQWERIYQKQALKTPDITRLEFLVDISSQKLYACRIKVQELHESDFRDELEESGEIEGAQKLSLRWELILHNSQSQLTYENDRKAFLSRTSRLAKHEEAILFDMINKRPIIQPEQITPITKKNHGHLQSSS